MCLISANVIRLENYNEVKDFMVLLSRIQSFSWIEYLCHWRYFRAILTVLGSQLLGGPA